MKTRLCLASVAVLILTACPEVHVPMNFGSAPAQLKAEDWNGLWSNGGAPDETIRFTVDPARPGILITSENDEEDDEKIEFHLRHVSGDPKQEDLFFAIPTTKDSRDEGTPYLLSRSEDDVFFFWTVNHDAIEAGVEKGVLKGRITKPDDKGSHIALDAAEANYRQLIKPQYWNWLQPTCIYRSAE